MSSQFLVLQKSYSPNQLNGKSFYAYSIPFHLWENEQDSTQARCGKLGSIDTISHLGFDGMGKYSKVSLC